MKLRALLFSLLMSGLAFGQGVSFQGPKIESQVPQPIAGLTISVCLATSGGTPCTPTVSVFSDSALSVPIVSLITDGDGMFSTFFISPGQYQWCASDTLGRISAYCTKFTAPAAAGSSPSFVNLTVTGNVAVGGTLGAKQLEGCRMVDTANTGNWAGSDYGAWVTAALTSAGAEGCVAVASGIYTQSTTAFMSVPATLRCLVPGTCIVNATAAITTDGLLVGPNGLTISTFDPHVYRVEGFVFTGGSAWAAGTRINKFVVKSVIINNVWLDAGNTTGWNVKYQSQNWDSTFQDNYMWSTSTGACYNGLLLNGYDTDNTTADNGQSFLYMLRNHIQTTNSCSTTGVIIDGFNSVMEQGNVAGFNPLIRVRQWGNNFQIKGNTHLEEVSSAAGACAVQYGDVAGDPGAAVSNFISGLTIKNSDINVHNSSFTTTGHPICPATATTGIINTILDWLYVVDITNGQPVVVQNNIVNQTGNHASNTGYLNTNGLAAATVFGLAIGANLHTQAGNISSWDGTDGEVFNVWKALKVGTTVNASDGSPLLPTYSWTSDPTAGWYRIGANNYGFAVNGTGSLEVLTSGAYLPAGRVWGWNSGVINSAVDTGCSRVAGNVIGCGNGTAADVSGEIRSARISATYNAAGTVSTAVHLVQDTCTLGTSCAVTLSGSAAFTSSSSYSCVAEDTTAAAATKAVQASGSSVTFTGTGTDVLRYTCIGN